MFHWVFGLHGSQFYALAQRNRNGKVLQLANDSSVYVSFIFLLVENRPEEGGKFRSVQCATILFYVFTSFLN